MQKTKNLELASFSPNLEMYGRILFERNEIDRGIYQMLPSYSSSFGYGRARTFKTYNPKIKTLGSNVKISVEESYHIVQRTLNFDKVNIVEVIMEGTSKALPFIAELVEHGKMGSYSAVGHLDNKNQATIDEINNFALINNSSFETHSIGKNITTADITKEVSEINKKSDEKVCNLFLSLGSHIGRLGYGTENNNIVANLAKSMGINDYLIVVNQIYDSSNIQNMVEDMQTLIDNNIMVNSRILADLIDPTAKMQVKHSGGNVQLGFVNIFIKNNYDTQLFGVNVEADKEITVMRYYCLGDYEFKTMFRRQNLRLLECVYNEKEDCAMYFLEKKM